LELRDVYTAELMTALRAFGVSTAFDAVAVAVFDHGAAPPGVSDRRFRFDYLREQVDRGIGLTGFGFLVNAIPQRMTRLRAGAARAADGDRTAPRPPRGLAAGSVPRRAARRHDAGGVLWPIARPCRAGTGVRARDRRSTGGVKPI